MRRKETKPYEKRKKSRLWKCRTKNEETFKIVEEKGQTFKQIHKLAEAEEKRPCLDVVKQKK